MKKLFVLSIVLGLAATVFGGVITHNRQDGSKLEGIWIGDGFSRDNHTYGWASLITEGNSKSTYLAITASKNTLEEGHRWKGHDFVIGVDAVGKSFMQVRDHEDGKYHTIDLMDLIRLVEANKNNSEEQEESEPENL